MDASSEFTQDEVARARAYHRLLDPWRVGKALMFVVYTAGMAFTPAGRWVVRGLSAGSPSTTAFYGTIAIVGLGELVRAPVSYWIGHRHELAWSRTTQSARRWAVRWTLGVAARSFLAGSVASSIVGWAHGGQNWGFGLVVYGGGAFLLGQFFASLLAALRVRQFRLLGDDDLKRDIEELARRARTRVGMLFVMRWSARTSAEQAATFGLGPGRAIAFADTLLARAPRDEVVAVAGHELAHGKLWHGPRRIALMLSLGIVAVAILAVTLKWSGLRTAIGASGAGDARCVPFLVFFGYAFAVVVRPLFIRSVRRQEREADSFALRLLSDPSIYARAMRNITVANLAEPFPGRLFRLLLQTHPAPGERVAAAMKTPLSVGLRSPQPEA